jgi:hypothetical protein
VELAPAPEALVGPWRKATVVVGAIAAIELVLLVAAGIALLGRDLAHHAHPRVAATPKRHAVVARPKRPRVVRSVPVGKPKLRRAATSVLVLNGNGRAGAAGSEGSVVTARGYRLARVGNASRSDYTRSVVMYRPGYRPEAVRLAHDVGIRLVAPLDGLTPAALGRAQLAVVVGDG